MVKNPAKYLDIVGQCVYFKIGWLLKSSIVGPSIIESPLGIFSSIFPMWLVEKIYDTLYILPTSGARKKAIHNLKKNKEFLQLANKVVC